MKLTPLQRVKKHFGSRKDLVEQLAPMVDLSGADDTRDRAKSRLMGLSNARLLRLYEVEQKVREKFGDRDKMIEHLLDTRRKAGRTADQTLRTKLEGYTKARLLDLTRQKFPPAPQKQTPEQRMAAKRGKKQRARAAAKAAG